MVIMDKCVRPGNEDDAEVKCEEYFLGTLDDEEDGAAEIDREHFLLDIRNVLGAGVPDGFMEAVSTCLEQNPAIIRSTWRSVISSLLELALMGVVPDGNQATLLVRGRRCTGAVLYEGARLFLERREKLTAVYADIVCANDSFDYSPGVIRRHGYRAQEFRGRVYAVYARAAVADGTVRSVILARHEVEQCEENCGSEYWKLWSDRWEDMAKLLALRALACDLGLERKSMEWCSRLG